MKPNQTILIALFVLLMCTPILAVHQSGAENDLNMFELLPADSQGPIDAETKRLKDLDLISGFVADAFPDSQETQAIGIPVQAMDFNQMHPDENALGATDGSCISGLGDAYNYIFPNYIQGPSDRDWYFGFVTGTQTLRFVLVPPPSQDYDMKIYDVCGTPIITCQNAGNAIENCTGQVTENFYIEVYGFSGAYNPTGPYWVNAHPSGTCSIDVWGTGASQNVTCNNPVQVSTNVQNLTSLGLGFNYFQDLWLPSSAYYNGINAGVSTGPNSNVAISNPFYPPAGGWTQNGTHLARSFAFGFCGSSNSLAIDSQSAVATVNCPQCTNECSTSGQNQCSGSNSQTCGNYDADSCLEWNTGTFCSQGCNAGTGQCITCTNDCSFAGQNQCNGVNSQTCGYFDADSCLEWNAGNFCSNGCNSGTGQCNACASHDHTGCFNNDKYWFNSCNQTQELIEDCRVSCEPSSGVYCNNGCLGNFQITAKNEFGQAEPNATVSYKRQDQSEFQFAGTTDSQGKFSFSNLWPYESVCTIAYQLKAVSQAGADCGTKNVWIDNENDLDAAFFRCPVVSNSNYLIVQPQTQPQTTNLGQALQLFAQIKNQLQTTISGALVGLIRPYNQTPLSSTSDAIGNVSFNDTSVPAGSHQFHFIASKINYHSGDAWKTVTVRPQNIRVRVVSPTGAPVPNAQITQNAVSVGFTNAQGTLDVSVAQTTNSFQATNAGINCGTRTVSIGQEASFVCPLPKLRVDVDNNQGYAIANVAIAINGQLMDFSNAFGYTIFDTNSGNQTVQIYYQLDENRPFFVQEQNIAIDSSLEALSFVASEQNGIQIGELGYADSNSISAQCGPVCLAGAAIVIYGIIATYQDITNLCGCVTNQINQTGFSEQNCTNLVSACITNSSACVHGFREQFLEFNACSDEYGAVAFDVGTAFVGAGLVKVGNSVVVKDATASLTGKMRLLKLPAWANTGISSIKKTGTGIWETTGGKSYNYIAERIPFTDSFFFKLRSLLGRIINGPTSKAIDDIAKNTAFGATQQEREKIALRTIWGVERNVIPEAGIASEAIEYTNRMAKISKAHLDQGWEPYADGIHQIQKVYKTNPNIGIVTKIGNSEDIVNTAILKKGQHYWDPIEQRWKGHGLEHITGPQGSAGQFISHAEQIKQNCNLTNSNEAVTDLIQTILLNGVRTGVEVTFRPENCSNDILVVLSNLEDAIGSLQDAYPI